MRSWFRENADYLWWQSQLAEIRTEVLLLKASLCGAPEWQRKAGFNQFQPRWPVGSGRVGGRWSGGVGGGAQVVNESQTGISTIDNTTEDLLQTLKDVVDFLPSGSGASYGVAVHTWFGALVRFGNFRGIGFGDVETTFGGTGIYGSKGSIRTDVILRNDIGDAIAIYDVKTGDAKLDTARLKEIRDKVGVGLNIPIIELHVTRGVSVKAGYRLSSYLFARRQYGVWQGDF